MVSGRPGFQCGPAPHSHSTRWSDWDQVLRLADLSFRIRKNGAFRSPTQSRWLGRKKEMAVNGKGPCKAHSLHVRPGSPSTGGSERTDILQQRVPLSRRVLGQQRDSIMVIMVHLGKPGSRLIHFRKICNNRG